MAAVAELPRYAPTGGCTWVVRSSSFLLAAAAAAAPCDAEPQRCLWGHMRQVLTGRATCAACELPFACVNVVLVVLLLRLDVDAGVGILRRHQGPPNTSRFTMPCILRLSAREPKRAMLDNGEQNTTATLQSTQHVRHHETLGSQIQQQDTAAQITQHRI